MITTAQPNGRRSSGGRVGVRPRSRTRPRSATGGEQRHQRLRSPVQSRGTAPPTPPPSRPARQTRSNARSTRPRIADTGSQTRTTTVWVVSAACTSTDVPPSRGACTGLAFAPARPREVRIPGRGGRWKVWAAQAHRAAAAPRQLEGRPSQSRVGSNGTVRTSTAHRADDARQRSTAGRSLGVGRESPPRPPVGYPANTTRPEWVGTRDDRTGSQLVPGHRATAPVVAIGDGEPSERGSSEPQSEDGRDRCGGWAEWLARSGDERPRRLCRFDGARACRRSVKYRWPEPKTRASAAGWPRGHNASPGTGSATGRGGSPGSPGRGGSSHERRDGRTRATTSRRWHHDPAALIAVSREVRPPRGRLARVLTRRRSRPGERPS